MRFLIVWMFFVILGHSAWATPDPDGLRALAYAGDVDGVEAAFVAIHAEERAGGISYDELRDRYLALIIFDPRVLTFTDRWLQEYPNSPHAHAIRAWQLYNASSEIRGEKNPRDTYSLALEGFNALQAQSLDHAQAAYQAAPDLVPASDALLALQMSHRFLAPTDFAQLFGDIMAVTPNSWSLFLATKPARPEWGGGGSAIVRGLCDSFAGLVTDVPNYDSDTCFVHSIFSSESYLRDSVVVAEASRILDGSDHPYLDEARLLQGYAATADIIPAGSDAPQTYHRNPQVAATLAEILSRPGYMDRGQAEIYDMNFAQPFELPLLLPMMIEREVAWAQERLTVDPYDSKAIAVMTRIHYDAYGNLVPDHLSVPQSIALLERRLLISPYNAEVWWQLARLIQLQEMSLLASPSDAYYENAIVYSNYDVFAVQVYLQAKYDQIKRRLWAEQSELSGRFMDAALFSDGFCPFIRLENLKQFMCNGPRSDSGDCGGWGPDPERILALALERATAANQCIAERRANPEDLAFAPVTVDLTD